MANRISGIKNIHLALYNSGESTYETPVKVLGAKSLSVKDNVSSVTFFSDNVADFNASQLSSKEVELELAYLTPEIEAMVTGKQMVCGGLVSTGNDIQNEVALIYELTTLTGKSIYNVLYNVKLTKEGQEAKTMEEGIDEQTVKLVGTAIVDAEGRFDYVLDANHEPSEPGEVAEFKKKITNWFTAVQMPTPAPSLMNK